MLSNTVFWIGYPTDRYVRCARKGGFNFRYERFRRSFRFLHIMSLNMGGFYFALPLFGFVGCYSFAAECNKDFTDCPKVGSLGKTRDEEGKTCLWHRGGKQSKMELALCRFVCSRTLLIAHLAESPGPKIIRRPM